MGLIFISHDLNLVGSFCDRVLIMYAGRIVETCRASELHQARHIPTPAACSASPAARRRDRSPELPVLDRDPAWALSAWTARVAAMPPAICRSPSATARDRFAARQSRELRRRGRGMASASSANRVPASPRCCAPSSGLLLDWDGTHCARRAEPGTQALTIFSQAAADGLPGPLRLAASAPDRRPRLVRTAWRSMASAMQTRASNAA